MDVLIVERDELIATVLVEGLAEYGVSAAVVRDDDEAMAACIPDVPQVVITGLNRSAEDLRGLRLAREMRRNCPLLAAVYMAALWPAKLHRRALGFRERFLPKPVAMTRLIHTVRELLPA